MGAAVLLASLALPTAAEACSLAPPPNLAELASGVLGGREVTGVYEQWHLAEAPNLVLRDARTISVVTRYWGSLPAATGPVMHGDQNLFSQSTCGNMAGSGGMVGYGLTLGGESPGGRGLPWVEIGDVGSFETTGSLTPEQESELSELFGPPVVVPVGLATRMSAVVMLWWQPVVVLSALGGLMLAVRQLLKRFSHEQAGDEGEGE